MLSSETLDMAIGIIYACEDEYYDPYTWRMTEKQYNRLLWLAYYGKAYRDAPRKLRKCELRKIARRRASERKRYI